MLADQHLLCCSLLLPEESSQRPQKHSPLSHCLYPHSLCYGMGTCGHCCQQEPSGLHQLLRKCACKSLPCAQDSTAFLALVSAEHFRLLGQRGEHVTHFCKVMHGGFGRLQDLGFAHEDVTEILHSSGLSPAKNQRSADQHVFHCSRTGLTSVQVMSPGGGCTENAHRAATAGSEDPGPSSCCHLSQSSDSGAFPGASEPPLLQVAVPWAY